MSALEKQQKQKKIAFGWKKNGVGNIFGLEGFFELELEALNIIHAQIK